MESAHQAVQSLIARMRQAAHKPREFERLSDQLCVLTRGYMEPNLDVFEGIQMGKTQRRLLNALHQRLGRVVTFSALYDAMYFDAAPDHAPHSKILQVQICKSKPLIAHLPYKIENDWGVGYRMVSRET